ncbi:CHCH domain-containing protein [Rhizoctonia solani AG-1 IA]|uniref:CHCH domain-containing protein n=1 Tax=Thanatephorus cucumeris (strain AG1-IA) TaxID=983506 RepID=L8X059_THACA|nr:CHCH domain-containing protein [Rhizoctonia solani AG-1 IA]
MTTRTTEQPGIFPEPPPVNSPEVKRRNLNYREAFQGRETVSKFIDPCEGASKASYACLNKHNFDRDKCMEYFEAYRDCKAAWLQQRRDDRQAGRPTK